MFTAFSRSRKSLWVFMFLNWQTWDYTFPYINSFKDLETPCPPSFRIEEIGGRSLLYRSLYEKQRERRSSSLSNSRSEGELRDGEGHPGLCHYPRNSYALTVRRPHPHRSSTKIIAYELNS